MLSSRFPVAIWFRVSRRPQFHSRRDLGAARRAEEGRPGPRTRSAHTAATPVSTARPHPKWRAPLPAPAPAPAPAQEPEFCDTRSPGASSPTPAPTRARPRPSHLRPEVTSDSSGSPLHDGRVCGVGGGLRGGGGGGGGGGRGRRVAGWGSRGRAETPGGRPWRRGADRAGSSLPSALAGPASEEPVLPRGASSSPGRRAMPIAAARDEPGLN